MLLIIDVTIPFIQLSPIFWVYFYLYRQQEFRIRKPRDLLHTCLGRTPGSCELSVVKASGNGHVSSFHIILRPMPWIKQPYQ